MDRGCTHRDSLWEDRFYMKSINVDYNTLVRFNQWKSDNGFSNASAAINALLNAVSGEQGLMSSSASDNEGEPSVSDPDPQKFSYDWFGEDEKAQEYFTGLPKLAFDWLYDNAEEEVTEKSSVFYL